MVLHALVAAAFIGYNGQPYAGLELVNELSDQLSDVAFSASVGTPSCLAVKGSYAFVVADPYRSLAIVDISDRASPTVVGALRSPYVFTIPSRDSVITEKGCDAAAIGGEGRGCKYYSWLKAKFGGEALSARINIMVKLMGSGIGVQVVRGGISCSITVLAYLLYIKTGP